MVTPKWTDVEQKAFENIKIIVAHSNLFAYPYFNENLDIHMDTRKSQIKVVFSQSDKPMASYSCKLTGPKTRYTLT